jgi:P pilus assembly chaperone PapD
LTYLRLKLLAPICLADLTHLRLKLLSDLTLIFFIIFSFPTKKKRNSIHPKRTKLHFVGAKSTTQSWVENPKGTQSNWMESQKKKTGVDRNP